jgi:hypothetical protein
MMTAMLRINLIKKNEIAGWLYNYVVFVFAKFELW